MEQVKKIKKTGVYRLELKNGEKFIGTVTEFDNTSFAIQTIPVENIPSQKLEFEYSDDIIALETYPLSNKAWQSRCREYITLSNQLSKLEKERAIIDQKIIELKSKQEESSQKMFSPFIGEFDSGAVAQKLEEIANKQATLDWKVSVYEFINVIIDKFNPNIIRVVYQKDVGDASQKTFDFLYKTRQGFTKIDKESKANEYFKALSEYRYFPLKSGKEYKDIKRLEQETMTDEFKLSGGKLIYKSTSEFDFTDLNQKEVDALISYIERAVDSPR